MSYLILQDTIPSPNFNLAPDSQILSLAALGGSPEELWEMSGTAPELKQSPKAGAWAQTFYQSSLDGSNMTALPAGSRKANHLILLSSLLWTVAGQKCLTGVTWGKAAPVAGWGQPSAPSKAICLNLGPCIRAGTDKPPAPPLQP